MGFPIRNVRLGFNGGNQSGDGYHSFDYKLPDFLFGHLLAFLFAQFSHPLPMILLYHAFA
jgi:hypothetical protein|nr:MAG TPA: hypothetical protein [Caudoviricetes sp.]